MKLRINKTGETASVVDYDLATNEFHKLVLEYKDSFRKKHVKMPSLQNVMNIFWRLGSTLCWLCGCISLLNRLFRRKSKTIAKLRVTGLCEGNSPVTSEFLSQRASNAENVSIWWRHHARKTTKKTTGNRTYFRILAMALSGVVIY